MNQNLDLLRKQIDQIDGMIINLLKQRMSIVSEVGQYKKRNNLPALDENRWQQVLETRIAEAKECGLSEGLIRTIWDAIHEEALTREKNI
ncbi:hypothetical protein BH09PAT2_BH09PAT2_00700 [soil metagenome]